jgi:hypothetical protein
MQCLCLQLVWMATVTVWDFVMENFTLTTPSVLVMSGNTPSQSNVFTLELSPFVGVGYSFTSYTLDLCRYTFKHQFLPWARVRHTSAMNIALILSVIDRKSEG